MTELPHVHYCHIPTMVGICHGGNVLGNHHDHDDDNEDCADDDEEKQEGTFFLGRSMRFIRAVSEPTII